MTKHNLIIGSGFTGLGAGLVSGFKVFEATEKPGGICASYEKDGFRFEIGGGHWIFGGDSQIIKFLAKYSDFKKYQRRSAVFFAGNNEYSEPFRHTFVDYPLQNNLHQLKEQKIITKIINEIVNTRTNDTPDTLEEWLGQNFGDTLCRLFFYPFHARYTAGLFKEVAPQDPYKSPFILREVINGAFCSASKNQGYNGSFLYPEKGLDFLARELASLCDIEYQKRIVRIDKENHLLLTSSGEEIGYEYLISTMPLNKTLEMSDITADTEPYTSVMVLNLGVKLAEHKISRHGYHWLYVPDSKTGFHRVGYYSNVDQLFLPENFRKTKDHASLYIEFAFRDGIKPSPEEVNEIITSTISELREWNFIDQVITSDITWIDVAYTWNRPNYSSIDKVSELLSEYKIISAGRYGRWNFQGIAESFREGIQVGSTVKLLSG